MEDLIERIIKNPEQKKVIIQEETDSQREQERLRETRDPVQDMYTDVLRDWKRLSDEEKERVIEQGETEYYQRSRRGVNINTEMIEQRKAVVRQLAEKWVSEELFLEAKSDAYNRWRRGYNDRPDDITLLLSLVNSREAVRDILDTILPRMLIASEYGDLHRVISYASSQLSPDLYAEVLNSLRENVPRRRLNRQIENSLYIINAELPTEREEEGEEEEEEPYRVPLENYKQFIELWLESIGLTGREDKEYILKKLASVGTGLTDPADGYTNLNYLRERLGLSRSEEKKAEREKKIEEKERSSVEVLREYQRDDQTSSQMEKLEELRQYYLPSTIEEVNLYQDDINEMYELLKTIPSSMLSPVERYIIRKVELSRQDPMVQYDRLKNLPASSLSLKERAFVKEFEKNMYGDPSESEWAEEFVRKDIEEKESKIEEKAWVDEFVDLTKKLELMDREVFAKEYFGDRKANIESERHFDQLYDLLEKTRQTGDIKLGQKGLLKAIEEGDKLFTLGFAMNDIPLTDEIRDAAERSTEEVRRIIFALDQSNAEQTDFLETEIPRSRSLAQQVERRPDYMDRMQAGRELSSFLPRGTK